MSYEPKNYKYEDALYDGYKDAEWMLERHHIDFANLDHEQIDAYLQGYRIMFESAWIKTNEEKYKD